MVIFSYSFMCACVVHMLLCAYSYVWVHIHTCVCGCEQACMCTDVYRCIWRPEVDIRKLPKWLFILFTEPGSCQSIESV